MHRALAGFQAGSFLARTLPPRLTSGLARAAGATSMYISATPTGSAVGFYLAHRAALADPVHPVLFVHEPDDIHLVSPVS